MITNRLIDGIPTGKKAGLGNIDDRLAEIRDVFAKIFPSPPDKLIVGTFLLLYLEVLYGCLAYLVNSVEQNSSANPSVNPALFNQVSDAIQSQFFLDLDQTQVRRYVKLLELDPEQTSGGSIIGDFESAIKNFDLEGGVNLEQIENRKKLIKGIEGWEGLEERIFNLLTPLTSPFTPTSRLITGIFLLIYLEVIYGFLQESTSDIVAVASAIQEEYCYSLHERLLHDEIKSKFIAVFDSNTDGDKATKIREVETQIFYRLNPLITL